MMSANLQQFCLQSVDIADHCQVWSACRNRRCVALFRCNGRNVISCHEVTIKSGCQIDACFLTVISYCYCVILWWIVHNAMFIESCMAIKVTKFTYLA